MPLRCPLLPKALSGLLLFAVSVTLAACGGGSRVVTVTARAATSTNSKPVAGSQSAPPSFPALVAHVRSGVVQIDSTTCDGEAIGTGFLIGKRLVATVEHV